MRVRGDSIGTASLEKVKRVIQRLPLRLAAVIVAATLVDCGGGGGSSAVPASKGSPVPTSTPTTQPSGAPVNEAAFVCPSSDSSSAVSRASAGAQDALRRHVARAPRTSPSSNLIAVTYQRAVATRDTSAVETKEQSLGARLVRSYDFAQANVVTHILAVDPSRANTVMANLRSQLGVTQVALTGQRRHATSVSGPYFTNDPYFQGFTAAVPPTYHVGPYEETASVPGQWDMHAIKLDYAFAYSQPGNGSGITQPLALGSSSVKIAIIDTGEDTTHPELHAKIAYQKCFISDPSNVQSTSNFTTDPLGHGTDVAGIAAADDNNGFGFTGTGGQVSIYGYRIFPTPDDNCTSDTTTDVQCNASTADIASAIEDAVAQHVNVISLSLGGDSCTNGQDSDPIEGNAIADAIAHNIIVVAAAGNDGSSPVEAPACDTGVIAVGASALGDGSPNGTNSNGSPGTPVEYVASYSDWNSPGASVHSSSAWGIVAPGGDPAGACTTASNCDPDDLHWIENIWTSQPYMASPSDTSFQGACTNDYPNSSLSTSPDCRTEIAGTSMATPHVAGVAALVLSVNSTYQSPAMMKQLLCSTADDIADPHEGCGRLNAYRALAVALHDPTPP